MKGKNFRKPTPRQLLEMQGVKLPKRMNIKHVVVDLLNSNVLVPTGASYKQAVETVENLEKGQLALFPSRFRTSKSESDYGIKSLDDLVKIDSRDVLKKVSGENSIPTRLTREFAEEYRIWPYTLIKTAMKMQDVEKPPIGFYWVGSDNSARATTWIRAVTGAEMMVMKKTGDFCGEIEDKVPYGRSLRVKVDSKTERGERYKFTLFRLPMHKRGDRRQFSDWINISHNSPDPDASYRGGGHEKRALPVCAWSASTIFAFYNSMQFVKEHPEWKQFRINPFPIPTNWEMSWYVDRLRLRSLILNVEKGKVGLNVLNKTEIDKAIGAKTILRKYDKCWHHWGKKDLHFLYYNKS